MECSTCGLVIPVGNKKISEHIDVLLNQSFEGWSEDAINGYRTACETLRHKNYCSSPVTYENFYLRTRGTFVECDLPEVEPSYISTPTVLGHTGSKYWYGSDSKGDYIIRCANHWCKYVNNCEGNAVILIQCKKIVKCKWNYQFNNITTVENIVVNGHYTGKIYLPELNHL